jgi:hypothetical protein
MSATNPYRVKDLIHTYGWDFIPRLAALGIQYQAEAQILFVDSGATNALDADDTVHGHSFENPLATIDYAIGLCTDDEGSVILVAPGHAETHIAASACITADVDGVKIICLGEGTLRPTITLTTDTGAIALSVTAAGVTVSNLKVLVSKDAVATAVSVTGDNCKLIDVEVADNAKTTEAAIGIKAEGVTDLKVINYKHNGFLDGDACTDGIQLDDCTRVEIVDPWLRGAFSAAAINMDGTLSTGVVIKRPVIENGTTALTGDVVDTVTSSEWSVISGFDVVGGYTFEGGSGAALTATDVTAVAAQTDKIDAATLDTTPVAYSLATYVAGGAGGIGTQLPTTTSLYDTVKALSTIGVTGAPVAQTLADTLHKDTNYTFDNTTDSLEAIADALAAGTGATVAIEADNLDHLLTLDGATHVYPENCVTDSILAKILVKADPAVPSEYDNSTDSLEAISDAVAVVDGNVDAIIADTAVIEPGAKRIARKSTGDMTGMDSGEVLFTVTGAVLARICGAVTTPVTSTSGTTTLEVGIVDNTALLAVQDAVDGTAFDSNFCWSKTTACDAPGAELSDEWVVIPGGLDIILTISADDLTAGAMDFYCEWIPLSSNGNVAATV